MKTRSSLARRLSEFLSFRGRATGVYVLIAYTGLLFISGWVAAFADLLLGLRKETVQTMFMMLVIPTFVRRMHDNGRSGWWAVIPCIGLIPRAGEVDFPLAEPSDVLALALVPFFCWGLYLLGVAANGDADRFGPDPRID